jgi:hypothetical protein
MLISFARCQFPFPLKIFMLLSSAGLM